MGAEIYIQLPFILGAFWGGCSWLLDLDPLEVIVYLVLTFFLPVVFTFALIGMLIGSLVG